jgi:hypothetical protein
VSGPPTFTTICSVFASDKLNSDGLRCRNGESVSLLALAVAGDPSPYEQPYEPAADADADEDSA